jgi:hypothetical protein
MINIDRVNLIKALKIAGYIIGAEGNDGEEVGIKKGYMDGYLATLTLSELIENGYIILKLNERQDETSRKKIEYLNKLCSKVNDIHIGDED